MNSHTQSLRQKLFSKYHSIPTKISSIIFLKNLISRLESDLEFLRTQKDLQAYEAFLKTQIHGINLEDNIVETSLNRSIFIQLPKVPGFLIECASSTNKLELFKATKIVKTMTNNFGKLEKQEFIVIKSHCFEKYQILDNNFIRSENDNSTLSQEQFCETIWSYCHTEITANKG